MGVRRKCWARAWMVLEAALLLCSTAIGCESWFRSETATPVPPTAATPGPTEEATLQPDATPTAIPPTPAPPNEEEYPYPVSPPEQGDQPAYPEAYPAG